LLEYWFSEALGPCSTNTLANPTLWVAQATGYPDVTLAHVGLGLLAIALWLLVGVFITSLEVKIWEEQ